VTGIPTVWMYVMSVWALAIMTRDGFVSTTTAPAVPWVGAVLLVLAGLMLLEAVRVLARPAEQPPLAPAVAAA
jgi:hypothetical protein